MSEKDRVETWVGFEQLAMVCCISQNTLLLYSLFLVSSTDPKHGVCSLPFFHTSNATWKRRDSTTKTKKKRVCVIHSEIRLFTLRGARLFLLSAFYVFVRQQYCFCATKLKKKPALRQGDQKKKVRIDIHSFLFLLTFLNHNWVLSFLS